MIPKAVGAGYGDIGGSFSVKDNAPEITF